MEFDELKSSWQQSNHPAKNKTELSMMTKISHHPTLKKLRIKFIMETLLLIIFLAIYYDGFDGGDKPLWVNIVLISSAVLFIANDVAGYFTFRNPVQAGDIRSSLEKFSRNVKRLAVSSVSSAFVFGCTVILFFSSVVNFTPIKIAAMGAIFIAMATGIYFSGQNWVRRINSLTKVMKQFND